MRSLLIRLLLAFGLTQALWVTASPASLVQAGGVLTDCSNDAQFSSLVASGGTVTFNCGTALINLNSTQTISANTTIDGGGQITLSGQNALQLFVVNPGVSLTLRNIVLENGFSSGNGGAIYNGANGGDGGVLNLENCTIRDSQAAFSGGAIISTGPLTITNSLLSGNRALNGGALYPRFAGAVTKIVNSVLRDNQATDTTNGWGGAILAWDGAPVTIEGSNIFLNSARRGGGIFIFPNSSVTLNGSGLYDNKASETGGGLFNGSGLPLVGTATLTNVTLSGNSSISGGGVTNFGKATLTNVTVSGNSAQFSGGGIYNVEGGAPNSGRVTLSNVTLSGNSAQIGGGISHYGVILALKNSIVANSPTGGNCFRDLASIFPITSDGFNLSDDTSCTKFLNLISDRNGEDPLLGPLANNGGPTLTHMPQANPPPGSPAIDHGSGCPATDQRGAARPVGPACDIGAVEYGAIFPLLYLPVVVK